MLRNQIEEVANRADEEHERRVITERQMREQADMYTLFRGLMVKCAADLDNALPVLKGLGKRVLEC